MPCGAYMPLPLYTEIVPPVVIRPIESPRPPPPELVNHSALSGPEVMPEGWSSLLASVKCEITPAVVICPIVGVVPHGGQSVKVLWLVNQSLPSGPTVIPIGSRRLGSV